MKKTISTLLAVITLLVLTLCSSSCSNEKLNVTPKEPLAPTFLAKSVEGIDDCHLYRKVCILLLRTKNNYQQYYNTIRDPRNGIRLCI